MTTLDATTLKYYQSIYTHCKQRFNIPDRIEVVKKSVYQYIENHINNYLFGNYNISEVRRNFYNNLVHYSQLETENLNSETLTTYFQELNFNIIKYCEETYPVQSQYSIDFESETETSNKGKQKLKQYSKTTPNTPILPKTTAKHLQTPEQGTSSKLPLTITLFLALLAQAQTPNSLLNRFARLEDFTSPRSLTRQQESLQTTVNEENDSEISEEESINSENKEDKMTAYIAKIPEFNGENIETRTAGEWFENLTTSFNDWTAFKTVFLEQFTNNNTSITLQNCFHNIKQKPSESVMTYIEKFNKLLRQICQLETNDYYSNAQILDQFITGLKDKLIKKICPHVSEDLNSAIQHAKRYKMAMEEANRIKLQLKRKLTNSQRKLKTISPTNNNSNPKDINHPKDEIKTTSHYSLITSLRIAITVEFLVTGKKIVGSYNETNRIRVINITLCHNNLITNHYYHQLTIHQDHNIKLTTINLLHSQCNNSIDNPFNITKYLLEDWFNKTNLHHKTDSQQTTTESTQITNYYLIILEEQNFHHTALLEDRAASPFLLNNAATNEQKAITAMYTEAKVKGKAICLILNIIVTADGMKKTPVGEIDNFLFTLNGITILVKVLVMDMSQYQAFVRNDWLQKANAKLDWEIQKLQLFYQGQHEEKPVVKTFMALESTSNWAKETEQMYFATNSYPEEPETPE
ncbi:hypothetical protein G9A89_002908 [Geosiphon pyriformis]|nr:hypothetical protein G9A89_002908 [Geosiphon pyriformis]